MKYNKEATDENILNTIENNTFQRSDDVKNIISIIEAIEGSAFISLDSAWGEGKTFLVKQIKMTLNYHRKKCLQSALKDSTPKLIESVEIKQEEKNAFKKNTLLGTLELERIYLPIYFDAWLYDNQDSALLALLLVIVKNSFVDINTKLNINTKNSILKLINSITFWKKLSYRDIYLEDFNFEGIAQALESQDILSSAYTLEEIRQIIKTALIDTLVENAQKLVIFIDELDRCRPTFAVELLESIKHYFEDDRIIFFISTNKEQLIHTIARYYGNDFDSGRYLNKFFDINLQLPLINKNNYLNSVGLYVNGGDWMIGFSDELQKIYNLSLRDCTTYFCRIFEVDKIIKDKYKNTSDKAIMLIIMVPIICIYEIIDPVKKQRIIHGEGLPILEDIIDKSEIIKNIACQLKGAEMSNELGIKNLIRLYTYIFGKPSLEIEYQYNGTIPSDFLNTCLNLCNAYDTTTKG